MKSFIQIVVGIILFISGCGFMGLGGYVVSELNNVLGLLIAILLLCIGHVFWWMALYIKLIIR